MYSGPATHSCGRVYLYCGLRRNRGRSCLRWALALHGQRLVEQIDRWPCVITVMLWRRFIGEGRGGLLLVLCLKKKLEMVTVRRR